MRRSRERLISALLDFKPKSPWLLREPWGFGPGKKFLKKTIDKIKNFCYNLITKEKERGNKKMMTNVDFEGFNDWSNQELVEARDTINVILELRKKEKFSNILKKIENAMIELQKASEEIDYFDFDGTDYSLADIFENIKLQLREKGVV